jgi:hypothetical protein
MMEISDATRAALLPRLDAALERWKTPRFMLGIITLLVPALTLVTSLLNGFKQAIENLKAIGIDVPTNIVIPLPNISSAELFLLFLSGFGYPSLSLSQTYLRNAASFLEPRHAGYAFLADKKVRGLIFKRG